jgi:hypothetical protein
MTKPDSLSVAYQILATCHPMTYFNLLVRHLLCLLMNGCGPFSVAIVLGDDLRMDMPGRFGIEVN